VVETTHELLSFDIWDKFKNEARGFRAFFFYYIIQSNNVGSTIKRLQNFSFTIDFFSADRLQNFDHTFFVVECVASLVDF
jgi:hypothetical protein